MSSMITKDGSAAFAPLLPRRIVRVDDTNPVQCTPEVHCSHTHGPNCGHEAVPHGDPVDYLHLGRPASCGFLRFGATDHLSVRRVDRNTHS